MSRAPRGPARRGYVLVVLIVVAGIVLMFALLMARLTVLEQGRQRHFALQTWADEAIASARDWSRLHALELAGAAPVRLTLDNLVPRSIAGTVALQRGTAGNTDIVWCRITLQQGGARLSREVTWPLPNFPPPVSSAH